MVYIVYIYKSDTYNVILTKRLVYNIEVQIFNQFYFPIFRKCIITKSVTCIAYPLR